MLEFVKKIYRLVIPIEVRTFIARIRCRERLEKEFLFGFKNQGPLNPEKKILYLTFNNPAAGIYSTIYWLRYMIQLAEKRNFHIVLDLSKTYMGCINDLETKDQNPWDFYYRQPFGISISDALKSSHVMMMDFTFWGIFHDSLDWDNMTPEDISREHELFKKYFQLNEEMSAYVEKLEKEIFPKEKKILGVSIRAGFRRGELLKNKLFNLHPRVPDINYYIEMIQSKLPDYDYIFISSDDYSYRKKLVETFGDKCLFIDRPLGVFFDDTCEKPVAYDDLGTTLQYLQGVSKREITKTYLAEIYLLARCTSLIGARGSGACVAAIINNNNYVEYELFYDGLI